MTNSVVAVDSSAIIAILLEETEKSDFLHVLGHSRQNVCSTVTFLECVMVLSTRAPRLSLPSFAKGLADFAIEQVSIDPDHGLLAAQAFLRFGKGRHPASLNLGDCFSYALAKSLNAPLLYKGNDFIQTDIVSAAATGAHP